MLLKLAFRNIFRNFKRTLITTIAIAIGLMFLIVMDSMLTGMDEESFTKIINYETGHISIFAPGYQEDVDNLPLDKNIEQPTKIMGRIIKNGGIIGIAPRVHFQIQLSDGIDSFPAIGIAINPIADQSVFLLKQAVIKGEYLTSNDEEAMLLGEGLAEDFGVDVGDYLTILTRTKYDTYQALDLQVKGLLRAEDPKIDWQAAVIPLGLGQDSLDLGQAATEVDIKLRDPSKLIEFKERLTKELPGTEVYTWKQLAEDVIAIAQAKRGGSVFIMAGIFIIALIGISNTILLAAYERTREIGMMAAMGLRRGQIVRLFVYEGAMVGMIGSVIGCLLGIAANYPIVEFGINWGYMMRDMGDIGYRITAESHGIWNPNMIIMAFIFGVIVSALTSIYPARVASRMEPTEALKKI